MADNSVQEFAENSASFKASKLPLDINEHVLSNPASSSSFKDNESSKIPNLDSGHLSSSLKGNNTVEIDEAEASTSKIEEDPEWLDILGSGHLKKRVIIVGKNDTRPHRGESVIIDVVGKLEGGAEFERISELEITIGDAEVVQGIEYALPLMYCGETAEIIVSPRFGYGSLGDLPRVPKDSTLNYIVTVKEVLDIIDIPSLSPEDRLTSGLKKKERGNWWYQRKEYHLAIQCYRKALQFFDEEGLPEGSFGNMNEAILKTYNNLSVALFNIEAYDAALTSVNNVLSQAPQNVKAIYRKVKILRALGEIEQAISVAKDGLKSKPDSPAIQDELNILIEMKKKTTSAEKVLYRKMFKGAEDKSQNEPSAKRTIYSVTWKWVSIITVAVGIIGAAAIKFKY